MAIARPAWVEGKRVAKFFVRIFRDGRGGVAHDPVFIFEDGSEVWFSVEETDVGEYGVSPNYIPASRKTK